MNNRASYIALGVMIAILLAVDVFLLVRTVSYRKEIAIKDETIEIPNVDVYFAPSIIAPDEISAPYFFILHEDMTIGELFIPDKSSPKHTNVYLEMVSEKYYKL